MNKHKKRLVVERMPGTTVPLPRRATEGSAGIDFVMPRDQSLFPGQTMVVPSGFRVRIPDGYVGLMYPRSSARKRGVCIEGVIDCDYRGEVGISIRNASMESLQLKAGERIAQMIVTPVEIREVVEGCVVNDTARGEGGYGSTGI